MREAPKGRGLLRPRSPAAVAPSPKSLAHVPPPLQVESRHQSERDTMDDDDAASVVSDVDYALPSYVEPVSLGQRIWYALTRGVLRAANPQHAFDSSRRAWNEFKKRGYIFSHQAWTTNAWDLLLMLMIVYIAFYAPLVLAFPEEVEWSIPNTDINHASISNAMDLIFLIDVVVKSRTSFTDHGYEVTDPHKIWLKYVHTFFFVDLISALPLGFFFTNDYIQFVTLIRLMRIWRLIRRLENLSGANAVRSEYRPHMNSPHPYSSVARASESPFCLDLHVQLPSASHRTFDSHDASVPSHVP